MNFKLSHIPYISTLIHSTSTIPQQWVRDIKHVEFNELLASSASALALIFRWKKADKSEFIEIASGISGVPEVQLSYPNLNNVQIKISISHIEEYAIAFALVSLS